MLFWPSLLYLLMDIFYYCLGFLDGPVYEQLHSEFQGQETTIRIWKKSYNLQIKFQVAMHLFRMW